MRVRWAGLGWAGLGWAGLLAAACCSPDRLLGLPVVLPACYCLLLDVWEMCGQAARQPLQRTTPLRAPHHSDPTHPCAPTPRRRAGDVAEGARLFSLAADKFDNALDLEPQNGQAMRLAGQSLLDAGLCTLGTLGGGGDGSEEAREARALIKVCAGVRRGRRGKLTGRHALR